MYTLDTNAIIYYFKNDAAATPVLHDIFVKDVPIYISAVAELELFSFQNLDDQEMVAIENLLKTVVTIPLDSRLARVAGSLRRQYGLKVPDSAIAATALLTGSALVTRNTNDFRKISNLVLFPI